MDLRFFELHDLLCEALIALEAGDCKLAVARLGKALRWVEADWLATPSALPVCRGAGAVPDGPAGDD